MIARASAGFPFSFAAAAGNAGAAGGGPISAGCSDSEGYRSVAARLAVHADGAGARRHTFACRSAAAAHAGASAGTDSAVGDCGAVSTEGADGSVFSSRTARRAVAADCCCADACVSGGHRCSRFRCCIWTCFVGPPSYFPYLWGLACKNKQGGLTPETRKPSLIYQAHKRHKQENIVKGTSLAVSK